MHRDYARGWRQIRGSVSVGQPNLRHVNARPEKVGSQLVGVQYLVGAAQVIRNSGSCLESIGGMYSTISAKASIRSPRYSTKRHYVLVAKSSISKSNSLESEISELELFASAAPKSELLIR